MFTVGLKLWSTNKHYIDEAVRLFEQGIYNYIELYCVPGSFQETHKLWQVLQIPFVIHAPHFRGGLNFAKKNQYEQNMNRAEEAFFFADALKSSDVIFHPGIDGDIHETVRQISMIHDKRMIIENKPYFALDDGLICNGYSPEEIKYVMDNTGVRFCLDIGHAICAANALQKEPISFVQQYLRLNPVMYHLTDGDINGITDIHFQYGKGTFPLQTLVSLLPYDAMITNEAEKQPDSLESFKKDIMYLRLMEKQL